MAIKKLVVDALGKLLMPEFRVDRAIQLGPKFRRLTLSATSLEGTSFSPGDKLQILVDDGPRTYTPFAVDRRLGTLDILVYAHGDGPGARWGRSVAIGDRARGFGPRRSLAAEGSGPFLVFGDETSLAVARAIGEERGDGVLLPPLLEVTDRASAREALDALALVDEDVVERRVGDGHLDAVEERLRERLGRHPNATLLLTGRAQSIQAVRARLKGSGARFASQKVKAYWAPGKKGLD